MYNKGFWVELPMRILKNLAMLPLEALVLVLVGSAVRVAYHRARLVR